MALLPLYGFREGDSLVLLILVQDTDPVHAIADTLQQAAQMRVAPFTAPVVMHAGKPLDANETIANTGIKALARVDVVASRDNPISAHRKVTLSGDS